MNTRPSRERFGARLLRLRQEPVAGLVAAIVALPDGLAAAAMIGVNPILGLYASTIGPAVGGALSSTQRMLICATSASALTAAEALAGYPAGQREQALSLLVLLVGGTLVAFGFLRAGRMTRFISHAVMIGFLLGVAVALVLNQLPPLLGYRPPPGSPVTDAISLITHLDQVAPQAAATGVIAVGLLLTISATRLRNWAPLIALMMASLAPILFGWNEVPVVGRHGADGLPLPALPRFDLLTPEMVLAALAIAVVISIQAAGVSQTAPNLDGSSADASHDMKAQGAANLVGAFFSAIPVGGSVGQTALNVSLGARTRWAAVSVGFWMLAFIVLIPHLVARVPTPALAGLMVTAGLGAINWKEARSVWRVGGGARWAIVITFVASLATSIPNAIAIGVIVTVVYFVFSSAADVTVLLLRPDKHGHPSEGPPPLRLKSNAVTVLEARGSLFFAGARTLAEHLPKAKGSTAPVVILRLRGYSPAGATLVSVLDQYAGQLRSVGGTLFLSGIGHELEAQLRRTGKPDLVQNVHIVGAEPALGASTHKAVDEALAWLETHRPGD
jgi:SulP family sulfate permease